MSEAELRKEIDHARSVQQMLLPAAFPAINEARLAYIYEAAFELSGDFLDFYYKRGTGELGLFICDVSGHGIPAAMLAAMTKMALHLWGEYLSHPEGTLKKIARQLDGKLGDDYLTAGMCYINLKTGRLAYARAGHTPLFIIRKNKGIVEKIASDGGIIHDRLPFSVTEYETKLEPGDTIILYTDGLTEFEDIEGKMMGEEGLQSLLLAYTDHEPRRLCDEILDTKIRNSLIQGARLHDDVTLFAIKYKGNGA